MQKNRNSPLQRVEDYVHMTAEIGEGKGLLAKGASVECTWDFAPSDASSPLDELRIVGSKGSLKMAGMSPVEPIEILDANGKTVRELTFDQPEHTAQQLIQAVTNDLRGAGSSAGKATASVDFLLYGYNAIRTQRVLDTILESYYGGREIGYWEREDWPGSPLTTRN